MRRVDFTEMFDLALMAALRSRCAARCAMAAATLSLTRL